MKKERIIRVCGSIIKKEPMIPLKVNLLEDTCIAEANSPYSNYYGNVPQNSNPNSLFLFTTCCYTLEEVLRFAQKSNSCLMQNINLASAVISFQHHHYPAIRIKNFPDYTHLPEIQKCMIQQGVEFAKKVQVEKEALIRVNKCFILEETAPGLYFDLVEKDKGYIMVERLLNENEFETMIDTIKNNSNCRLFDAVKCGIIHNAEVFEMIRIYTEKLDLSILKCIQEQVRKQVGVM
jgi:hypothetical protein